MQVMRTSPDIGEYQCPEVHHRQAIGINRASSLFRHEVIHDAEKARCQKETDRVMAIPPLHHRVLYAGIGRVRLPHGDGNRCTVEHMQHRDGDDEGTKKPVGNVDVRYAAAHNRAEENHCVTDPDQGDQNVDRPFQFGVFLAAGKPHRQGDRRQNDNGLPTPESECGKRRKGQFDVAGMLHHVVGAGKQRTAAEGKDDRVGVQWAQATEGQPGNVEVEYRPGQLCGDQHTHRHADQTPHDRHDRKLPYDFIIVGFSVCHLSCFLDV